MPLGPVSTLPYRPSQDKAESVASEGLVTVGVFSYLLKEKSRRSKTSTGPVLLRMVRGWPAIRQKAAPATAVPRKLSSTP